MTRILWTVAALLLIAFVPFPWRSADLTNSRVTIGSKSFTESVILGEMARHLVESSGTPAIHIQELGGTRLVFDALLNGEIDLYTDYTGTIAEEILGFEGPWTLADLQSALADRQIRISQPLGFNNTYVLAMSRQRAEQLAIETISDLKRHPDLALGFSNEFMDRQDGWPGLKEHYGLPQHSVSGMEHGLAYHQLNLGAIDVMDAYATDAKIEIFDLKLLQDDRNFFPEYKAVLLYRGDLERRFPDALESVRRLQGNLSEPVITRANRRVEFDGQSDSAAAAAFLADQFGLQREVERQSAVSRILQRTIEHLDLVRKSLIPAILVAIPLGILAWRHPALGQLILGATGIIQTVPALALLVLVMPLIVWLGMASVGLGSVSAIVALFLYSLLPIVRNTYSGLQDIGREYRESATALGLSRRFRLLHVELPLATRSILAGVKTAAVINVGFATLGALIGAGGYGQPIITGLRLNDTTLIYEGAIPAAILALLVQGLFELAERSLVPRGLRSQTVS